jgi:RimJ/RimL family protein N-acetyltransferase
LEQALETINNIRRQYVELGIGRWAVIEKSSGNFIGWSGLKLVTEAWNGHINFHDVGYRLIPKYWGKGYATESCKAALEFGFNTMNLSEIIGTANQENKASRTVLEKCGLTFVEQFMWKDIQCDWLKISKEDWVNK